MMEYNLFKPTMAAHFSSPATLIGMFAENIRFEQKANNRNVRQKINAKSGREGVAATLGFHNN